MTDGIGRNGKVDTCSMPIDGNCEEFEFGTGLKFNDGVKSQFTITKFSEKDMWHWMSV